MFTQGEIISVTLHTAGTDSNWPDLDRPRLEHFVALLTLTSMHKSRKKTFASQRLEFQNSVTLVACVFEFLQYSLRHC